MNVANDHMKWSETDIEQISNDGHVDEVFQGFMANYINTATENINKLLAE